MHYDKVHTSQISFPLGGIGSGCIGLRGNGRLEDWEIYNRANKNSLNALTHFAIRTEGKDGVKYRILQGDSFAPYTGTSRGETSGCTGFGWGPNSTELAGLPHFRMHEFNGTFPAAEVIFSGEEADFPLSAKLTAWSPFIPGMDRASSMPCAVLEYAFRNPGTETLAATVTGVLCNPWWKKGHFNRLEGSRLTVCSGGDKDGVEYGDITLSAEADGKDISGQEYLYRGGWMDAVEMYLNDLKRGGRFAPRAYPADDSEWTDHGLIAVHFTLKPGDERVIRFILSWNVPNRENTWNAGEAKLAEESGIKTVWKNYYATQWADSIQSAAELEQNLDKLRSGTFKFRDDLAESSLAPAIIDGASANLSTLRTPTCMRLEDGTLWGWEGIGVSWGSCPGSCIHVWNYAQAVAFLFPAIDRSMIESHLNFSVDENGGAHFRLALPLGVKAKPDWFRPCADGQFGLIMQCFRDWKSGAGLDWIKSIYPTLKRMMEFTWSDKNTDQWDPDQSGMLTGRTHHTLDMELFAPNSWLEGIYLGALLAMSKIAHAAGDSDFSDKCARIFEKGQEAAKTLFNGRYFQQNIDLTDKTLLSRWEDAARNYWNDESKEIKYQIGEGCSIDACLGECHAHLYGLGHVFEREMTISTLMTIYKYNFVRSFRENENPWRIYGLNDESGVRICTWPDGAKKPAIPIPYNTETMHGFEWSFAIHLMLNGFRNEAEEVAKSIRDRYDGAKRNPWNEIECGSNYARSMASFGLIPAQLGFKFDMDRGYLGFAPVAEQGSAFRCLWSIGTAWGVYAQTARKIELSVDGGAVTLNSISLPAEPVRIELNGKAVLFTLKDGEIRFDEPLGITSGTLKFLLKS